MQQIKPVQTIQPVGIGQLPAPEKPKDKAIYPVETPPVNKPQPYEGQAASMTGNIDRAGFGFDGSGVGLLGKVQYSKDGTEPIYNQTASAPNPVPPKPGTPPTGGRENSATTPAKPTGTQQVDNSQYQVPKPAPIQNTFTPAQYQSVTGDALANAPKANVQNNNYTPTQYQSVIGDALANAPKANVQNNTFTPNEYQNLGTNGVTSSKQYQYDPRKESLVQNQITGLLDPNSAMMRKAVAQAQSYNAARGLQSSSIGNEVALSSMIDKAMPIAQQDAQTYNQAQSQQWQTQAQLDQLNLKNQQEAAMADKQGAINNQLQNNQMSWQTSEKNADRQFQAEIEDLKYKQSLGTLDAQGQQRLQELNAQQSWQTSEKNADRQFQAEIEDLKYKQSLGTLDAQGQQRLQELNAQQSWQTNENNVNREFQTQLEDLKYRQQLGTLDKQQSLQLAQMERSAQIQTDRDAILQQYQVQLNELQNDQRWKELNAQIEANFETQTRGFDQQTKMEYGNAQSTAVNAAMQAIGMAMSNPNMTAEQQKAAVANIVSTLQSQANMLSVIYGASATTPPPLVTPPPATGNTGSTGGSGGTGGSTGGTINPQAKTGTYPGAGYIGGDVGGVKQQQVK